jgi:putative nucleotidyltransferase with HDIG domain
MTTQKISKQILDTVTELQSMPVVFLQAMEIMKDENFCFSQLSKIISKDLALSTKILNLVNSSYYGFPTQITRINDAISLLGTKATKNIIMGMAMKPMMISKTSQNLWKHSIRCAIASQIIAANLRIASADEAFVTGLLHDVGRAVFIIYDQEKFKQYEALLKKGEDKLRAEEAIFEIDHAELGYEFAKKHQLPIMISDSIRYHHEPQKSPNPTVSGIIYVAEMITQETFEYSLLDSEIFSVVDFEISNPVELRELVFKKSEFIIGAL